MFGLVHLTYIRCLVWLVRMTSLPDVWFGSFDIHQIPVFGMVRMMGIPDVWFGSFEVHQMFGMFCMMGVPDVWLGSFDAHQIFCVVRIMAYLMFGLVHLLYIKCLLCFV